MSKDTNTKIDFSKWQTQAEYARENGVLLVTVSQWVKRSKEGKGNIRIEYLDVPEMGVTLVKKK